MEIEPTYCRGARGDVVAAIQAALMRQQVPVESGSGTEPALAGIDGDFDVKMQRAVQRVQRHNKLLMSGVVDQPTWKFLMGAQPWPSDFERLIYVMAGFENHFYSKATGNQPPKDRVGMTWGLIGFTLVQPKGTSESYRMGPLRGLLLRLLTEQRQAVDDAFGEENAQELETALQPGLEDTKADANKLHRFAVDKISTKSGKTLKSPWLEGFRKLGELEAIREVQRDATRVYYDRAERMARDFVDDFSMGCERTSLYFLDFAINNGDFLKDEQEKPKSQEAIKKLIKGHPNATVAQKLECITEVLQSTRGRYADDIRQRKSTLASGYGMVHGKFYRLEGWGIDVSEPGAPPSTPKRLAVIGLDGQRGEQIALARGAMNMGLATEPAAASLSAGRFPAKVGYELLSSGTTQSVAMSGLASIGAPTLNDNTSDHYEAAQMLFRGHIGVLALSGQITQPVDGSNSANQYVLQRTGKTFAGVALKPNDQLVLMRQRVSTEAGRPAQVDITDMRRSLSDCRLLLLYGGYGVPIERLQGSGPRWREWIKGAGGDPIVLGWFGSTRSPQDDQKRTLADVFLARVQNLKPTADLMTILKEKSLEVIEQWGAACHEVFAGTKQKYLWLDEPVPTVLLMKSGAAAIDRSGGVWRANPIFGKPAAGQPPQPFMIRV